ncbi:transposase family protein [Enterococcus faecalis]|nr:transposase family protein [Enterococcus faecalis]
MIITSEMLDLPEIKTINLLKEQESYVITCQSKLKRVCCPTCGCPSRSVHSYYNRIIQNLPIAGKTVYLKLIQRRFRYQSNQCSTGFFTQSFTFVESKGKKTIRLEALIQRSRSGMITVQATSFLKTMGIRTCKSTLSQLLFQEFELNKLDTQILELFKQIPDFLDIIQAVHQFKSILKTTNVSAL